MGGGAYKLYFAKQASGPSESVGVQDPSLDTENTYWSVVTVDDGNVVHKSGNETIKGYKYFNSNSLSIIHPVLERGVSTEKRFTSFVMNDKDGKNIAAIEYCHRGNQPQTDGSATDLKIVIYKDESTIDESSDFNGLSIGYDTSDRFYAKLSMSTNLDRTDPKDIVTRGFIPNDTRILHTTGDETKNGRLILQNYAYTVQTPGATKGTAPSQTIYRSLCRLSDSNDKPFCSVYSQYEASRANWVGLLCYDGTSTSDSDYSAIKLGYDSSGNVYTAAPTPATSDNSSNIATTAFVKAQNYVTCSTDQTISGNKTFTGKCKSENYSLYVYKTTLTKGTNPSSDVGCGLIFQDKNEKDLGYFSCGIDSAGVSHARLQVWDFGKTTTTVAAVVGLSCAKNSTDYAFRPYSDNNIKLGTASRRWTQLFAGTTTISTSDRRCKGNINNIPDNVLDAWEDVSFCQFQMADSIEIKGNTARLHNGLIAQQIDEVFKARGLDVSSYGLFCYDEWDAVEDSKDEKGNIIIEGSPAGNRYSLRYEEALCMEAAYNRREVKRLKERLSRLEERLAS